MNYKRHRPKEYTIRDCGYRSCKQDKGKLKNPNGKDRYLFKQWMQVPFEGKNPWRYKDDLGQIPY